MEMACLTYQMEYLSKKPGILDVLDKFLPLN